MWFLSSQLGDVTSLHIYYLGSRFKTLGLVSSFVAQASQPVLPCSICPRVCLFWRTFPQSRAPWLCFRNNWFVVGSMLNPPLNWIKQDWNLFLVSYSHISNQNWNLFFLKITLISSALEHETAEPNSCAEYQHRITIRNNKSLILSHDSSKIRQ